MGPGTDMAKPAGAGRGRLFKKQSHREAHEADHGIPTDAGASLFRKNALDEMTVRRTEKPVEGDRPVKRHRTGLGSHEDAADQRRHEAPVREDRPARTIGIPVFFSRTCRPAACPIVFRKAASAETKERPT